MVFSSIFFLFAYLPVFLIGFYLAPRRLRKTLILLASLVFYFWGENFLIWILVTSTFVDYVCGLVISGSLQPGKLPEKLEPDAPRTKWQKIGLVVSICTNLAFLGVFKYFNFFIDNANGFLTQIGLESLVVSGAATIALPIGISFYTFQSMSYTIDVYRGKVRATRNLIDFACYVTMFPQLVAGPIVRYCDIEDQLRIHRVRPDQVARGLRRFTFGLVKKVVIANTVSVLADGVFNNIPAGELTLISSWAGIIAFTIQIYFDFSGYSDMAIGLGMMLGFRFMENFKYPYISQSVREFWRRWHISLSRWFRDYLYIPLGGSRTVRWKTYRNLMIVFLLCGFWHGAQWTFVVWGIFHGLFLVLERQAFFERIYRRSPRPVRHIYALGVVMVGWVLFRAGSFSYAMHFLGAMVGLQGLSSVRFPIAEFCSPDIVAAIAAGIIFSSPIFPRLAAHFGEAKERWALQPVVELAENVLIIALFSLCVAMLASGVHNPFLYFRF